MTNYNWQYYCYYYYYKLQVTIFAYYRSTNFNFKKVKTTDIVRDFDCVSTQLINLNSDKKDI